MVLGPSGLHDMHLLIKNIGIPRCRNDFGAHDFKPDGPYFGGTHSAMSLLTWTQNGNPDC